MSKTTISFLVFIILVVIIFIGASVFSNLGKSDLPPANSAPTVTSTGASTSTSANNSNSVTATTSVAVSITMSEVQKHNSVTSCWTAVKDGVYDLTNFVSKHPGGAKAVLSLCGVDGTDAFIDQHGNQRRPNNELAGLKIGDLAK